MIPLSRIILDIGNLSENRYPELESLLSNDTTMGSARFYRIFIKFLKLKYEIKYMSLEETRNGLFIKCDSSEFSIHLYFHHLEVYRGTKIMDSFDYNEINSDDFLYGKNICGYIHRINSQILEALS